MFKTCLCNSTSEKMAVLVTLEVETHEKCRRKCDGSLSCVNTEVMHVMSWELPLSSSGQSDVVMWFTAF